MKPSCNLKTITNSNVSVSQYKGFDDIIGTQSPDKNKTLNGHKTTSHKLKMITSSPDTTYSYPSTFRKKTV